MKLTTAALTALVFLGACGRADRPDDSASTANPCAVALTPHRGTAALDHEIARLQDKARQARERLMPLEQLGWAFVAKARVSFDTGFYKLAEQVALCMTAAKSPAAEAILLRGHALQSMHRFREAEEVARELVARRGRSFDYGLLGDALMEQGKLAEAVKAYQTMMDERPSPEAYVRAAHVRWTTGDLPGAVALMGRAVGTSGFRDPEAVAWANTRLALYEFEAGKRTAASRRIDVALAAQADYAPALLARGRLLLAQGEAARAIDVLTRAAALNPIAEYQWTLIEALRVVGRHDEADGVEARLVHQGPVTDRRTVALYLASTRRDPAAALRLAQEELEARADVLTLDALGWALWALGRIEEAQTYSERALEHGTRDARLLYHAGAISTALGRRRDAARLLASARKTEQMLLPSERVELRRLSHHHERRPG